MKPIFSRKENEMKIIYHTKKSMRKSKRKIKKKERKKSFC